MKSVMKSLKFAIKQEQTLYRTADKTTLFSTWNAQSSYIKQIQDVFMRHPVFAIFSQNNHASDMTHQ